MADPWQNFKFHVEASSPQLSGCCLRGLRWYARIVLSVDQKNTLVPAPSGNVVALFFDLCLPKGSRRPASQLGDRL